MKIAYFDCFAGASGDMILGALLDAGLEIETLKTELAKLGLSGYDVEVKKVVKRGIGGSQAIVIIDPPLQHNDHKTGLLGRQEHHHHHDNHYDSDPHHDHSHEHQGHTHHDHNLTTMITTITAVKKNTPRVIIRIRIDTIKIISTIEILMIFVISLKIAGSTGVLKKKA